MAFYQGSVVNGSGILNAQAVQAQIKTTILTHPNWSFVETTTFGASYPTDVYKCSGTGNGFGVDFYVGVMQLSTSIVFVIAEGYNSVTHKPQRPIMLGKAAAIVLQADGGLMPIGTELDWYSGVYSTRVVSIPAISCPVGGYDFYIGVAADALYYCSRGGTSSVYVGAYESLVPDHATNDPLPLVALYPTVIGVSSLSIGDISFNRHPMRGGLSTPWACTGGGNSGTSGYNVDFEYSNEMAVKAFYVGSSVVGSDHQDLYRGGGYASRFMLYNAFMWTDPLAGRDKLGWVRGTFKYFRYMPSSGVSFLDTVKVDGVTYVNTGCNTPHFWFEKDPA